MATPAYGQTRRDEAVGRVLDVLVRQNGGRHSKVPDEAALEEARRAVDIVLAVLGLSDEWSRPPIDERTMTI